MYHLSHATLGEKNSKDLEYPELLEQKEREKTRTLLLDI